MEVKKRRAEKEMKENEHPRNGRKHDLVIRKAGRSRTTLFVRDVRKVESSKH